MVWKTLEFDTYDGFSNLALEETLFETLPADEGIFLLYQNNPSVVMGKHQNPLKEIQLPYFRELNIPLIRRCTGGGTVWHDTGNLVWSFITPKNLYEKKHALQFLLENLRVFNNTVESNVQGDLYISMQDVKYKISGSASAIKNEKTLFHGTLLCHSELKELHQILGPTGRITQGTAVSSRPTKVANLNQKLEDVKNQLLKQFQTTYTASPINQTTVLNDPIIFEVYQKNYLRMQSPEWIWGSTPDFIWTGDTVQGAGQIEVQAGIITKASTKTWIGLPYQKIFL